MIFHVVFASVAYRLWSTIVVPIHDAVRLSDANEMWWKCEKAMNKKSINEETQKMMKNKLFFCFRSICGERFQGLIRRIPPIETQWDEKYIGIKTIECSIIK